MTIFDQISNDLKSSRLVMHKLGEIFTDFQTRSYSMVSLCEQWRTLQGSFAKIHSSLEERVKEVEVKETKIDDAKNKLKILEKEVELRQKKLDLEEKSLRERINEVKEWLESLELEKSLLGEWCKAVEEREKVVIERGEALDAKEKELNLKKAVLKHNEVNLEKEKKGLESNENELYFAVQRKEKENNEESSMLMSKEKLLRLGGDKVEEQFKGLELKEKEIYERSQVLEVKEKRIQEREVIIDLKEKAIDLLCKQMEVREKEIIAQLEALQAKEKRTAKPYMCNPLSLLLNIVTCNVNDLLVALGIDVSSSSLEQQVSKSQVACVTYFSSSSKNRADVHSFCQNMDANGLRLYLIIEQTKDNYVSCGKILLDALNSDPNIGKLVLDVCQSFHQIFTTSVANKNGCIFLLEQFMKLQAPITSDVKVEAMNFASFLNPKLKGLNSHLDNFGFLQFSAAFRLSNLFTADELLSLLSIFYSNPAHVYRLEQQFHLCHSLGLSTKIPGVIKVLIEKKKYFTAMNYICVFKLENRFPPVPLLEACLDSMKESVNEKCKNGTSESKIQAEAMELVTLQDVIKCVATFNLELNFPFDSLVSRVKELEMERNMRHAAVNSRKKRRATSSCTSEEQQLQKRPRVEDVHLVAPIVMPYSFG